MAVIMPKQKARKIPKNKPLIGFIGQGFIGKNYADDFEKRGYSVIRYAMEEPYKANKDKIKDCDIVFIAVPTPTTPKGFDDSILRNVVGLVGKGKIAVIKSTVVPGLTEEIQKEHRGIFVMHSPEFLIARTAAYCAAHPDRNIIGIPTVNAVYKKKAKEVMAILPKAPFELICFSREAELVKYGGNNFLYFKVIFANLLYDLTESVGARFDVVRDAMIADPRIGSTHLDPIHESGRGAGGLCFIKDFAAFKGLYEKHVGEPLGLSLLAEMEKKNLDLLLSTQKDLDLLKGVYGPDIAKRSKKK
jgi:nucleotide sugar dehydrogenase